MEQIPCNTKSVRETLPRITLSRRASKLPHAAIGRISFVLLLWIILSALPLRATALPGIPPGVCDTIIINDTIYIRDTVRITETIRDTVFVLDNMQNGSRFFIPDAAAVFLDKAPFTPEGKRPRTLSPFALTFSFSPSFSDFSFSSTPLYRQTAELNNGALTGLPGFSAGVGTNYQKGRFHVRSSLNFMQLNQHFSMSERELNIDSVMAYKYYMRPEIYRDTVWFINIDTLLSTGDTLLWPHPIENTIMVADSVEEWQNDTSEIYKNISSRNQYRFIDIPLLVGYSFGKKHYRFQSEAGIISSFLVHSKGNLISLEDENKSADFSIVSRPSPVIISYYLSAGFKYYVNVRSDFTIKMYYRESFNSLFNNYPLIMKSRIFGLQLVYSFKLLSG